jgi:hypothetical protein
MIGVIGSVPCRVTAQNIPFTLFAVDQITDELLILDPSTGARTVIGPIGFGSVSGLAYNPQTDTLFSVDNATGQLIKINRQTGVGTAIGQIGLNRLSTDPAYLGFAVTDLTFGPNNTLFGMTNGENSTGRLIRINQLTGQGTLVSNAVFGQLDGLAFHPRLGKMYASFRFGAGELLEVDPSTGSGISLGQLGPGFIRLAADPNSNQLFAIQSQTLIPAASSLFLIDPATLSKTRIGFVGEAEAVLGIEAVVVGGSVTTPHITTIDPTSGPVGTLVTITGSNFGITQGSSTVSFGGTAATVSSWSDTQIKATVPSLQVGIYSVSVITNAGQSNIVAFNVTAIVPPGSVTLTVINAGGGRGRVVSMPDGIDCRRVCAAIFRENTNVKLMAVADPGSSFVGWNKEGCSREKPCTMKMTDNQSVSATFIVTPTSTSPKAIYIGVCGSGFLFDDTCLENQGWYDPTDVTQFANFNPLNENDLDVLAQLYSGLDSIGLRIGTLFPTSVTLVTSFSVGSVIGDFNPLFIRNNVPSIVDFVVGFYKAGDQVYLVGHSSGGGIIQEVAKELDRKRVPVAMTAQIDSVGLDTRIAGNVTRAFNYFYPGNTVNCPISVLVEKDIVAEKKSLTIVTNESITDPKGINALSEFCGGHKNMDNDPRVWRPIMNHIIQSIGK